MTKPYRIPNHWQDPNPSGIILLKGLLRENHLDSFTIQETENGLCELYVQDAYTQRIQRRVELIAPFEFCYGYALGRFKDFGITYTHSKIKEKYG